MGVGTSTTMGYSMMIKKSTLWIHSPYGIMTHRNKSLSVLLQSSEGEFRLHCVPRLENCISLKES